MLFLLSKSLCFPQSCGSSIIKSRCSSKSDSLGIPSPFAGSPAWEAWRGVQKLHNSGRTSLALFFRLWVAHLVGVGFDFIVIIPIIPSHCSFLFVFGHEVSFWGVPASSCPWFFNSYLQFWCSRRRTWAHILLLCHLKPKLKFIFNWRIIA